MSSDNFKNDLFEALSKQHEFAHLDNDYIDNVCDFLIHQGIQSIDAALDYHTANSEEELFNWIHEGADSSPFDLKTAPLPSEMGNVLIDSDDFCFFWYDLDDSKEPYNPFEDKQNEDEMEI